VLLFQIFKVLSKDLSKVQLTQETEVYEYTRKTTDQIIVEEFDAEAELEAEMWNMIVRAPESADEPDYRVSF
jgi:hypothetical protein